MRDVWAAPTEGWNWAAGVSQGWFGIDSIVEEPLLMTGPMWLRGDKLEPVPNLAKSWKWSDDGTQLTMNLVKGIKWSDGQPFTADDVMFTWEDVILDPGVVKALDQAQHLADRRPGYQPGEGRRLHDQVDLPGRRMPTYKLFDMNELNWSIAPAHVHKPFHPKYNTAARTTRSSRTTCRPTRCRW